MKTRVPTAVALVASLSCATAEQAAVEQIVIDGTTEQVLLDACAYLRSAGRFSAQFDTSYDDVLLDGTTVQYNRSSAVTLVRPDRLRIDVEGDRGERNIYYDGRSVTVYRPESGLFAVAEAPDKLDAMLDLAAEKGISVPLDDLLYAQPCAALGENLRTGTYAGLHYLDGDWYHHLLLETDALDMQLWVAQGDAPWFRKVVMSYREKPGAPRHTTLISDWDFDPQTDDAMFQFDPPEGARRVAFQVHSAAQGEAQQ